MTHPLADVHVTVEPLPGEIVHFTEEENEAVALCGADLADAEDADGPVPDAAMCVDCMAALVIYEAENTLEGNGE